MSLKVGQLRETTLADVTRVRFFPSVDTIVNLEMSREGKCFRTDLTFVRLLTTVDEHVAMEVPRSGKHLTAVRTLESAVLLRTGFRLFQALLFVVCPSLFFHH